MKRGAIIPMAAVILCALLSSCGHSSSEFDSVTSETIITAEDFYQQPAATPPSPERVAKPAAPAPKTEDPKAKAKADEKTADRPAAKPRMMPGRIPVYFTGRLYEVFNDSNHQQLTFAQSLGIQPITDIRGLYRTARPIVRVASCKAYTVDSLKHSLPFLVPEAERLLRDIGRDFADTLLKRGGSPHRIIATSLLRTPASVKRLRRVNRDATENSTHQYGTTFDISYVRFHCLDSTRQIGQETLKNLLAETLLKYRNQGRCMVKYERHTGCFHITATH